ncbi:MAG: saccharopine dehydrogenase NADP-binding domain-containing protein [Bacteroidetes bacterium]|nr:saccharopine dehydrogenase NADP-binding domain-containing protein [Bacteroidota bacterium]
MKIAVLGAGMVGRTIAIDLSSSFDVTSIDKSEGSLTALKLYDPLFKTLQFDLTETDRYNTLLQPFDIVVAAVPGFMGYNTLKGIIEAGKSVIDISFSPEDMLSLDSLAKEKSVTAIVDCGVAPGMSNFILGRYNEEMKIENFECYVGGLPKIRKKPFEYKAPFSPVDVIEEYMRPARMKENGQIVTKTALSDIELMEFDEIGTLESFNTDGLRSILDTMGHIPNMKEKTLRYPGHANLIIALQRSGFFNTMPVSHQGQSVNPLSFTASILFNEWKLSPGEEEFTVMKVIVEGMKVNKHKKIIYSLLDRYDVNTQTSSMARSTGYTATAAVHLLANKIFDGIGVYPPEKIGSNKKCFEFVLNYLKQRNVVWRKEENLV